MTRRIDRLRRADQDEERYSLAQFASDVNNFGFGGIGYQANGLQTTWNNQKAERASHTFAGYAEQVFKANGVIFSLVGVRMRLFSEARFQWQRLNNGRPGDLYGTADLSILEVPWVNATTGDLMARMEVDASLAGNFYGLRSSGSLYRLRPDWVDILLLSPSGDPEDPDAVPVGYVYWPQGPSGQAEPRYYDPSVIVHFAPIPDPMARYKGMSWITPVLDEITSDNAATTHKLKFFENAATPNVAVSLSDKITEQQFQEFVKTMREDHEGVRNAYRTLYLAGGADAKVIGADLRQLDFKATQGAGETRLASASGIAPVIAGLSEGLAQATYSNYGQARRMVADSWLRPQWRSAAGALEPILPKQPGARLWYDSRDVSFLQEDESDAANIQQADAVTIKTLVDAGFDPDSVKAAVAARDMNLLTHSGLVSVQLQPPGAAPAA